MIATTTRTAAYIGELPNHVTYTKLERARAIATYCQRLRRPFLLAATALATLSAGSAQTTTTFVPFNEFVQGVKATDAAELFARPAARVTDTSSVSEMQQHLLKLYQGVNVSHSYVLDPQTIDCVPVNEQPSVRTLGLKQIAAAPPSSALASPAGANGASKFAALPQLPAGKTTDGFGNALGCEAGTVPMRRITLDQMSHFKTLKEFFEKGPNGSGQAPEPAKASLVTPSTYAHKYGFTYQYVNNLGDNTNINLWRPYIYTDINEVFSLAQSWTIGYSSGPMQTAEVGWQNYPARTGTESSTIFIYYTADGYNNTGCYDLTCGAFVQVNNTYAFGVPFAPQYYSVPDGAQSELPLQFYLYQGNWWLAVNGTWIGYYPGTLYGGGQLANYSNLLEFGGESVGLTVWPAEGSSLWASDGWTNSAYQRELWYRDLSGGTVWDTLTADQPSPACYSVTNPAYTSNWGTYFFFGGPGGASCQ